MLLAWGFKSDRNKNDASVQMRRPYFLPIKRQVFNNIISVVYHTDRFQFGRQYNTVVENCQKVSLIQGVRELFCRCSSVTIPYMVLVPFAFKWILAAGLQSFEACFTLKYILHISLFQMWHDTLIAYKCSSAQWNFSSSELHCKKDFLSLSINFHGTFSLGALSLLLKGCLICH